MRTVALLLLIIGSAAQLPTEGWPFDQPMYLILNVAFGGSWGGQQGIDDSALPQSMVIDYVRVYQHR